MRLLWRRKHRGFTLVELLIVIAIILVIITIAIPDMMNTKEGASETVVMRECQTIYQMQIQYMSQFGTYAKTLAELGPPANGPAGPTSARLISARLASGEKDGYLFTVTTTAAGFAINANPKAFGSSGRRTFYLDETGVLRQNWGPEPATANSPDVHN